MKKFIDNVCPITFLILLALQLFNYINISWIYVLMPLFVWALFYILAFAIIGLIVTIYFVLYTNEESKDIIQYFKDILKESSNKNDDIENEI